MLALRIAFPLSLVTALACASAGARIPSDRPTDVSPVATSTPAPVVPDAPMQPEDAEQEHAPQEPERRSGVQNGVDGRLFGALVDEHTKRWQVVIITYNPAPKIRKPIDVGVAVLGPDALARITDAVANTQQGADLIVPA